MTAPAKAVTQSVLYRFCSQTNCDDGADPAGVVAAPNGSLYGVTTSGGSRGGAPECQLNGCGVVYELTQGSSGWSQTVLYRFQGGADGANPLGKLLLRPDGSLVGITAVGGLSEDGRTGGTVFELTPPSTPGGAWIKVTIHAFPAAYARSSDGRGPVETLVADVDGNVFGVTGAGGPNCRAQKNGAFLTGCCAIFELSPPATPGGSWTKTVVWGFKPGSGDNPGTGVTRDASGALFGTTLHYGGINTWDAGLVFKLTQVGSAWVQKVLHKFKYRTQNGFVPVDKDMRLPRAGLTFDGSGNVYGTTSVGGVNNGGTVFRIAPTSAGGWKYTTLHSFPADPIDGSSPWGRLALDGTGSLIGSTAIGGGTSSCGTIAVPISCGTIFKLTPPTSPKLPRSQTVLYRFNGADGAYPEGELIVNTDGTIFGTTINGGIQGGGVVYKLSP